MPSQPEVRDLIIRTTDNATISVRDLLGFVVVIGFVGKGGCDTGPTLEVLNEIYLDVGPSHIRCLGCIVDLERGEPLKPFSPFVIPIGAASRRSAAEFLRTPMSGFHLPQFVIIDRRGALRLRCIPCGDDYWEVIKNLRFPVDTIVDEGLASTIAAAADEGLETLKLP